METLLLGSGYPKLWPKHGGDGLWGQLVFPLQGQTPALHPAVLSRDCLSLVEL